MQASCLTWETWYLRMLGKGLPVLDRLLSHICDRCPFTMFPGMIGENCPFSMTLLARAGGSRASAPSGGGEIRHASAFCRGFGRGFRPPHGKPPVPALSGYPQHRRVGHGPDGHHPLFFPALLPHLRARSFRERGGPEDRRGVPDRRARGAGLPEKQDDQHPQQHHVQRD